MIETVWYIVGCDKDVNSVIAAAQRHREYVAVQRAHMRREVSFDNEFVLSTRKRSLRANTYT